MKKNKLPNGLRVIYTPTKSDIVAINVSVLVGSNDEPERLAGISHAIEHMLFEGTKTRTSIELTSTIENYGGDMNAYTTSDKTNYYIKIHKKYVAKAIEILADMTINPSFEKKILEKEKGVILEEIDMINDEPRHYQWIVFQKNLFSKPISSPTYGTKKAVKALTSNDMRQFHKKHYTPNKMIITIVGNCPSYLSLIKSHFKIKNKNTPLKKHKVPLVNKRKTAVEKKKNISQHYMILGYRTPNRFHKDSYVLDVIEAILAKGQSGRLFDEIRTKRGLTYDLGIYHRAGRDYGYFTFYSGANKDKISQIEKIYFDQVEDIKKVSKQELKDAKSYIEGNLAVKMEDSHQTADTISFFEECGDYKQYKEYLKKIKKVTQSDIKRVIGKYLNAKYTKITLKGTK